jgi:hypothetical protein
MYVRLFQDIGGCRSLRRDVGGDELRCPVETGVEKFKSEKF